MKVLLDAIDDANDHLTDEAEDGGLGVSLLEFLEATSAAATADNDVYVYSEVAATTIASFGTAGQDSIYFGGAFNLVALGEDDDLSEDRLGSSTQLEIFMQQDGADLALYVENIASAGNAKSGTVDFSVITLTGVSSDDVSFVNGFFIVGTVA